MRLRFFIIDDLENIRLLLRYYLTFLGHEVICAENPRAENICAKIQCTSEFPCADGYFVDLTMPHMTGIEYLENTVRRGCKVPPLNKVLFSGNLTQEASDRAKELGVTLMEKPIELSKIGELVVEMQSRVDPNRRLAELPAPGQIHP